MLARNVLDTPTSVWSERARTHVEPFMNRESKSRPTPVGRCVSKLMPEEHSQRRPDSSIAQRFDAAIGHTGVALKLGSPYVGLSRMKG